MGILNQRNYYQVQGLSSTEPIIKKMVGQGKRMTTIYRFLREEARWNNIGDYPIVVCIFWVAKKDKKIFTPNEVRKTLRQTKDQEFQNINQNHKLITQLYG